MSSAMAKATIVFSRFINFPSGIEVGGRRPSWAEPLGRVATLPAVCDRLRLLFQVRA
jgi:hypothetical protein